MLKQNLGRILTNMPGWRTDHKIVVIESDDWGSIRMPSREVYEDCLKSGYQVDLNAYERYDSLASEKDLELFFEVLTSFRDKNGNHPVITANCVVANPDFEKIKTDGFKNYHYELITETFKRYPGHAGCFNLWKQGMSARIFHPQYHCREHVNVSRFMDALQKGDRDVLFGFNYQMPGCIPLEDGAYGSDYIEAIKYNSVKDKEEKLSYFLEGLDLFEKLFGYRSESIIPPNYIWSSDFNKPVYEKKVMYFQGLRKMREPVPGGKDKYNHLYMGKKNDLGQRYLIRNVQFEPSLFRLNIKDPVRHCLNEMALAFLMRKPAIICTHRLNYVGFIHESNRDRNLKFLKEVLTRALARWPEIEFMTTNQLGYLILQNKEL